MRLHRQGFVGGTQGSEKAGRASSCNVSLALSEQEREGKLGENILDHHAVQGRFFKAVRDGTSLVVQWLRLHTSKARGMDSISG